MKTEPASILTRAAAKRLKVITYEPGDFLAELASLLAEACEMNRRAAGVLTASHEAVLSSPPKAMRNSLEENPMRKFRARIAAVCLAMLSAFLALPVSLDAQTRLPYNLPQVREYLRVEPTDLTFAIAAGGANVSEVTITTKNAAGTTLASTWSYRVWLSDSATCAALTTTTTSGTVTAKAASGVVVSTNTAKKDLNVSSLATGVFILEITDTAKTGFFVCGAIPGKGKADASAQLVTGSYG